MWHRPVYDNVLGVEKGGVDPAVMKHRMIGTLDDLDRVVLQLQGENENGVLRH